MTGLTKQRVSAVNSHKATEVTMSKNPVEEFLAVKEKTAGMGSSFTNAFSKLPQHMGHAAAGAVAAGAVGLAGAGISAAAGKIFDAATKGHDFRSMMQANEDLHPHYEADPKKFNLMFNTLRTMNPEYSKDPLVAGSFIRRMIESPMGIGGIAGEALQHRGDFPESIFGTAHEFARGGAQTGAAESMKDKFHAPQQAEDKKRWEQEFSQKERQMTMPSTQTGTTDTMEYTPDGDPVGNSKVQKSHTVTRRG
jgi:hypothetical protein